MALADSFISLLLAKSFIVFVFLRMEYRSVFFTSIQVFTVYRYVRLCIECFNLKCKKSGQGRK